MLSQVYSFGDYCWMLSPAIVAGLIVLICLIAGMPFNSPPKRRGYRNHYNENVVPRILMDAERRGKL